MLQRPQPQRNNPFPQNTLEQRKIDAQQQQRQQQQQSNRQADFTHHREVNVDTATGSAQPFPEESPCFPISTSISRPFSPQQRAIDQLTAANLNTEFDWALWTIYRAKDLTLPHCFGAGINELIKRLQMPSLRRLCHHACLGATAGFAARTFGVDGDPRQTPTDCRARSQ